MTQIADRVKAAQNWDQFHQIFKRLPVAQDITKIYTKKILQQLLSCVVTTAKELAGSQIDDHLSILWLEPEGMELLDEGKWFGLLAPLLGASSVSIDFLRPKLNQGYRSPNPRIDELLPAVEIRLISQVSSIKPLDQYTHIVWSHPTWEMSFNTWQQELPGLFSRPIHVFGWSALDAMLERELAESVGLKPSAVHPNPFSNESTSEQGSGWARYCYELAPVEQLTPNEEKRRDSNWLWVCRHHSGLMGFANPRWQPGSQMRSTSAGKVNRLQDYVYVLDNVVLNLKTRTLYLYQDETHELTTTESKGKGPQAVLTRIAEVDNSLVDSRPKGTVDLLETYKWAAKLKTAYFMGPTKQKSNDDSIFNLLKKQAESGDPFACYGVASWYESGVGGLGRDLNQALNWYRKSADAGFASALYTVGDILWEASQHAEALEYWKQAAEKDHAGALHNLGIVLLDGMGVPADPETGIGYIARAADIGLPHAQAIMADHYLMTGDRKKALEYLIAAADQGLRDAAHNAARIIEDEVKAGKRKLSDMKLVKKYDAMAHLNESVHG